MLTLQVRPTARENVPRGIGNKGGLYMKHSVRDQILGARFPGGQRLKTLNGHCFCHLTGGFLGLLIAGAVVGDAPGQVVNGEVEASALDQVQNYIARQTGQGSINRTNEQWRMNLPRFPEVEYRGDTIYLHLETDRGDVKIRSLPEAAPNHVANLLYLVDLKFYDGMAFQYMLSGERVQTGCPIGDGHGTPGYTFAGELGSGLKHDRAGLLSMMNTGRGSDGSQFFITLGAMPWMDGKHTIFGEVVEGMDTLHAIGKSGVPRLGIPKEKIHIKKAWIEEVRPSASAKGYGGTSEIHEMGIEQEETEVTK